MASLTEIGQFINSVATPVSAIISGTSPAAPPQYVQSPTYVPTPEPAIKSAIDEGAAAQSFMTMKYFGVPVVLLLGGAAAVYFLFLKK